MQDPLHLLKHTTVYVQGLLASAWVMQASSIMHKLLAVFCFVYNTAKVQNLSVSSESITDYCLLPSLDSALVQNLSVSCLLIKTSLSHCHLFQIGFYGVLANLGIGEFLPNRLTAPLYATLCPNWILDEVCAAALGFIFYGPSIFITPDDYLTIATTWPSSVGTRNLVHWAQVRDHQVVWGGGPLGILWWKPATGGGHTSIC